LGFSISLASLAMSRSASRRVVVAVLSTTWAKPVELDPLTVADDDNLLQRIAQQPNVPAPLRNGLSGLY
jgi:hypothetical protein